MSNSSLKLVIPEHLKAFYPKGVAPLNEIYKVVYEFGNDTPVGLFSHSTEGEKCFTDWKEYKALELALDQLSANDLENNFQHTIAYDEHSDKAIFLILKPEIDSIARYVANFK